MKIKIALMLALALMMSLTVGSTAFARGGINNVTTAKKVVRSIALNPTPAGDAIPADGKVRVRTKLDGTKDFSALVEAINPVDNTAAVPAGTTYRVVLNGTYNAGNIVMDNTGHGSLDYTNNPADAIGGTELMPASFPGVLTIKSVKVFDSTGTLILSGSF